MLGGKRVGRVVDHVLSFMANRQNAMRAFLDRDNRRLVDDDALACDCNQRVRSAKVDSHVRRHTAEGVHEAI